MRLRRLHHSSGSEAINATPLIDVVMCLIIFFLIVGKLSGERGPMVKLPETGVGQQEQSPVVMIVTVARSVGGAEGAPKGGWGAYGITVHLDGQATETPKALEAAVRGKLASDPSASVQVRADRELAFGSVEPVLRAAGQGGAKSVRLATERVP